MQGERLLSINEAAAELGLHRITVGRLVKSLGITPARLRYSPSGKGLNSQDLEKLRKALGKPAKRERATA